MYVVRPQTISPCISTSFSVLATFAIREACGAGWQGKHFQLITLIEK